MLASPKKIGKNIFRRKTKIHINKKNGCEGVAKIFGLTKKNGKIFLGEKKNKIKMYYMSIQKSHVSLSVDL